MDLVRPFVLSFVSLLFSTSAFCAVIANFGVNGVDGVYDSGGLFTDSGNGQYIGSATLHDTGLLMINGSLSTYVSSSETGGLGAISTLLSSEMHFSGVLSGNIFSSLSVSYYNTLSCQDTGSTGIFAGNACANLLEPELFSIFTDPVIFDLTLAGTAVIDWNGSSQAVGQLTPQQSVSRTTFTTVPLPAGLWLFLSALAGLVFTKRECSVNHKSQ